MTQEEATYRHPRRFPVGMGLSSELELFLKECVLAGYEVRGGVHLADAVMIVKPDMHPNDGRALLMYREGEDYSVSWVDSGRIRTDIFKTVDDVIDFAEDKMREW